ncbi:MAG: zinc dependent phospholipase C family protein [Puia sp.]|nr:zinc dependent phospholipase C family protein [Puia sp.]
MRTKKSFLLLSLLVGSISLVYAWGAWGHQHINRAAIFALPAEMRVFFFNHADFLTQESDMPDVRKHLYHDRDESARHFINLEEYGPGMMDSLPLTLQDATAKFGTPFLQKNGTLPWFIPMLMDSLTKAFRERRKLDILFLSANLGHYIGDAHMPLHTSVNHDGLKTGQRGIHGFWEGQIPEMFGDGYNLYTGTPKYIDDITRETRRMIAATYLLADSMLLIDRRLKEGLPENKIYKLDAEGHIAKSFYGDPVHSKEYAIKYHAALNGMVERQLRAAIRETASFWYTAWVNAGKPDLGNLDPKALTQRNQSALARDLRRWKQGKVDMINPDPEY